MKAQTIKDPTTLAVLSASLEDAQIQNAFLNLPGAWGMVWVHSTAVERLSLPSFLLWHSAGFSDRD
jgi:hypothetical protein